MRKAIFPVAVMLLLACNDKQESAVVPATFEYRQLAAIMKDPKAIDRERIARIAGTEATKLKTYQENFSADVSKRTIVFSWPNGEKKSVKTTGGKELQLEGHSSLGLGFVKKTSEENFRKKFAGKASVQEEINSITKDENIDADIAISEARYLAENARLQQFDEVENVGEAAYWETPVNALHVYARGISFTVTTNMENEKASRKKAVELTKFIFSDPLKLSE